MFCFKLPDTDQQAGRAELDISKQTSSQSRIQPRIQDTTDKSPRKPQSKTLDPAVVKLNKLSGVYSPAGDQL